MKKILIVFTLMFTLLPLNVSAQETNILNGTYLTEENNAVKGYHFDEGRVFILVEFLNASGNIEDTERVTNLINLNSHTTSLIDPVTLPEDVEEQREELKLNCNLKVVYTDVANQITEDMTHEDVQALIDARIPGIEYENNLRGTEYFKISSPTVEQTNNKLTYILLGEDLFTVEIGEDGTITDDYGVNYIKAD